jgi:xylulokinase
MIYLLGINSSTTGTKALLTDANGDIVAVASTEYTYQTPLPSAVHFFLVDVGGGAAFRRVLLKHGVLVRGCASFGLPAYAHIATRRPEENEKLIQVVLRRPVAAHQDQE